MDVARKVVILARECGLEIELSDVQIESLVPAPLQKSSSAEAFLADLPQVQRCPLTYLSLFQQPCVGSFLAFFCDIHYAKFLAIPARSGCLA